MERYMKRFLGEAKLGARPKFFSKGGWETLLDTSENDVAHESLFGDREQKYLHKLAKTGAVVAKKNNKGRYTFHVVKGK